MTVLLHSEYKTESQIQKVRNENNRRTMPPRNIFEYMHIFRYSFEYVHKYMHAVFVYVYVHYSCMYGSESEHRGTDTAGS